MSGSETKTGIQLASSLIGLIGIQVCINGAMAGIRMAAPLLALRHGYSAAAVGVLLALFAVIQIVLAVPAGRYADRHSLKRPVLICMTTVVLGAGLATAWPVFPVFCLAAMMSGGASGAVVITLQRHAVRMTSDTTALKQVFSWLSLAPSIANFVGPLLAGLMIDFAGFQSAFAVMAVLPLFSVLLLRKVSEVAVPAEEKVRSGPATRSWDLLVDPRMRLLLLVSWVLTSCWDVHTFVLPILGHERQLSASVIGLILGAFAMAATAVRLILPMLADRLKEWAVISASMVISALLYAIYPLLDSPLAMGACSVLLGLALGTVQPMVMSALHFITPPQRQGEALGLRLMSVNLSNILMPLIFGCVGAAIGVTSVFWATAASVACFTPAAWRLRFRQNESAQASASDHHR